jgi:hypothetical protein
MKQRVNAKYAKMLQQGCLSDADRRRIFLAWGMSLALAELFDQ